MSQLSPVRPGCGQCDNCRYLRCNRFTYVTCLISPGPGGAQRWISAWDDLQAKRPCTAIEKNSDEAVPEHECNDCGIMIQDHLEICSLCERWYEDRGLPLPKPPAPKERSAA